MQKKYQRGLMWFRRDLRAQDNAALSQALRSCEQVFCVFIFDRQILDALPRADRRVEFIRESLVDLALQLKTLGSDHGVSHTGLIVQHVHADKAVPALARVLQAQAVFMNHDDEPQALARDAAILASLEDAAIALHSFKDHVVLERCEVLTLAGKPYTVFTPYKNAWMKKITDADLAPHPVQAHAAALATR